MSLITAYNFYLNSRARNYGQPNNFTFTLKNPISKNGVIPSEFRCKIPSAQIPFSFHQFVRSYPEKKPAEFVKDFPY